MSSPTITADPEELLGVLSRPDEDQPAFAHYTEPPEAHDGVHQTFCGR